MAEQFINGATLGQLVELTAWLAEHGGKINDGMIVKFFQVVFGG